MQWHPIIKSLHWLMAVLLLSMLGFGFMMSRLAHTAATTGDYSETLLGLSIFDAYQLHKSFGVLLFALVMMRAAFRFLTRPAHHPKLGAFEARASSLVHIALYALMLSLPLTGWLLASSSTLGLPTVVFGLFHLPHPVAPNATLEWAFAWLHFLGGCALTGLAALHIGAALKHQFINRDTVLPSILPNIAGLRKESRK
nr:cytochrome b [uncultured Litoreibacter sp.]